MMREYTPYIPRDVGDIIDLLGWMMLTSPKFEDDTGLLPGRDIDTAFFALTEGMINVKGDLGVEQFEMIMAMVQRMRAHFEADPEDRTEDSLAGRRIIDRIQNMLMEHEK